MIHLLLLTITPGFENGELALIGDAGPNHVLIDEHGVVHLDGVVHDVEFDSLFIDLRGGDDLVEMYENPGRCEILLGAGDDRLSIGDATPGALRVRAGAGDDRIVVNDSVLIGPTLFDLGAGADEVRMSFTRTEDDLAIRMGRRADELGVFMCELGTPTTFHGGAGDDLYRSENSTGAPKVRGF